MIKVFLTTLAGLCIATSALAEPLPQGRFMLGTYVWPDTQIARYAVIEIEGTALTLEFASPLPLDYKTCEAVGACLFETVAARAQAEMRAGAVGLSEVDIDEDAPVEPETVSYLGKPAHLLYTAPLLGLIHGAALRDTETGFVLDAPGQPMEFFRVEGAARDAAMVVPLLHNLAISDMAHCEVRKVVPLYQDETAHGRELAVLAGVIHQWHLQRVPRPVDVELTEAETAAWRDRTLAAKLPHFAAAFFPERGTPFREPLWEHMGERTFEGDRASFDAAVASWGDALDPLVDFYRAYTSREEAVGTQEACADPFLGLLE